VVEKERNNKNEKER
jgi:hypothetical protein